jgi:hypothetical protein
MTQEESALLEAFLGHDFPGVEALRAQLIGLFTKRGCTCGCGRIHLIPQGENLPKFTAGAVPVSGHILDDRGEVIGGVTIFLEDGLLSMLDMQWYFDPLPLPRVEEVEWQF